MTNDELDDHRTNIANGIYGDDRMSRHDMDKAFDSLRAVCDAIEEHNATMDMISRKLDDIEGCA